PLEDHARDAPAFAPQTGDPPVPHGPAPLPRRPRGGGHPTRTSAVRPPAATHIPPAAAARAGRPGGDARPRRTGRGRGRAARESPRPFRSPRRDSRRAPDGAASPPGRSPRVA